MVKRNHKALGRTTWGNQNSLSFASNLLPVPSSATIIEIVKCTVRVNLEHQCLDTACRGNGIDSRSWRKPATFWSVQFEMADSTIEDAPPAKRAKLSEESDSTAIHATHTVPAATQPSQPSSAEGWAREIDCGVRAFINAETAQFACLFKHRYGLPSS